MKINENDIRTMNRLMTAEMLLKEAMVGDEEMNEMPEKVTLYSLIHPMARYFASISPPVCTLVV